MKAKVTKKGGWEFDYRGNRVLAPFGSVLNGDLASLAMQDGAAREVSYSMKTTPVSAYKPMDLDNKMVQNAPENKSSAR